MGELALVVCAGCGQVLLETDQYRAKGPVLPRGAEVVAVEPHDCPHTIPKEQP